MIEIQREEQTVEQGTEVRRSSIQAPAVSGCVTSGPVLSPIWALFLFLRNGVRVQVQCHKMCWDTVVDEAGPAFMPKYSLQ